VARQWWTLLRHERPSLASLPFGRSQEACSCDVTSPPTGDFSEETPLPFDDEVSIFG